MSYFLGLPARTFFEKIRINANPVEIILRQLIIGKSSPIILPISEIWYPGYPGLSDDS